MPLVPEFTPGPQRHKIEPLLTLGDNSLMSTAVTAFLLLLFSSFCSLICVSWDHLFHELPAPKPMIY